MVDSFHLFSLKSLATIVSPTLYIKFSSAYARALLKDSLPSILVIDSTFALSHLQAFDVADTLLRR